MAVDIVVAFLSSKLLLLFAFVTVEQSLKFVLVSILNLTGSDWSEPAGLNWVWLNFSPKLGFELIAQTY